ncbi:hypothetical protein EK904_004502 [Melospiza melodia maxima]|nr:hypothetical protein EK904_004502 [Melospiza melodia maxima]
MQKNTNPVKIKIIPLPLKEHILCDNCACNKVFILGSSTPETGEVPGASADAVATQFRTIDAIDGSEERCSSSVTVCPCALP